MTLLTGRRASRRIVSAALITVGTLAGTLTAQAQPETGSAPSEAFEQALSAYDKAWETSGLAFNVATFTENGGSAYGQYTPRADAVFADGQALSIYAEPVGYAYRETDGDYAFELTASYKLLNKSGQVLAGQDNFAVFSGNGRSKQRELAAALTFQFSGLPSGDYQLETTFTDEVNENQAGFTLPFTVTAPN
ncbi:MAG: hypothetical protein K5905_05615 [Roseibium sp.]|uniref:hypothetical protein n=1 Tax=Roseibium sp. TaxID=1936156 RepID=UPI00262271EB|nr:hypothetical protein [Roseibium sp.]MCV0424925.1 hypothetical protein [Roseibium sp.]